MKHTHIIAALCLSAITPLTAQTKTPPAPTKKEVSKPAEKKTANTITLETLEHVKSIFAAAATSTTRETATQAAKEISATTDKIVALQATLKATPMPTAEEKQAFAQKMIQYQPQVIIIMKKMTNTFQANTEEINAIIQPPFTEFKTKTTQMMTLINTYYPKKEMDAYIEKLKNQ